MYICQQARLDAAYRQFPSKTWKNIKSKTKPKLRGDIKDLTPEILVSQASTSTINEEGDDTNPNLLTTRPIRTHNTDALAIKLNRLR